MSERKKQPYNTPAPSRVKALTPRTIAVGGVILALVAAGVVTLLLTLGISSNQLDAIRTGGTLVVGAGGAVALLLAARRQRSTELELEQKYETAADARTDATERRITELYIKAADQLGSDKAPVRLAGLYALERLAQDTPHLRQTIVNVICAYLRMPYALPVSTATVARPLGLRRKIRPGWPTPPAPQPTVTPQADAAETARQEREVRLTAQSILAAHLQPGLDHDHLLETFWALIDLDLTDATLINLDLRGCRINTALLVGAQFIGDALFSNAQFTNVAVFTNAQFTRDAIFINAQFTCPARFDGAQFTGDAWFSYAQITNAAVFIHARFVGAAVFSNAQFTGDAWFNNTQFTGAAAFNDVQFTGDARFNDTQFTDAAIFNGTQFTRDAWFNDAQFRRGRPPGLNRENTELDSSDTNE